MARRPKAPKPIPITTLRAVAACHTVGLTYHGGTGANLVAVDDRGFYHFVRARTSRGVASAAHTCRSERDRLAVLLRTTAQQVTFAQECKPHMVPQFSRKCTLIELTIANPAWLCDVDGEFIDCPGTDDIMVTAGLDLTVEVSE